jgi:hypothetical protein
MLSQIAVQVSPDVMTIATKLNEKYHHDFDQAKWHADNRNQDSLLARPNLPLARFSRRICHITLCA